MPCSHGIGTARALQINEVAGAFSELGMGLNGVLTAILMALVAFLVTVANVPLLKVGAAFWGLVFGVGISWVLERQTSQRTTVADGLPMPGYTAAKLDRSSLASLDR